MDSHDRLQTISNPVRRRACRGVPKCVAPTVVVAYRSVSMVRLPFWESDVDRHSPREITG
ncbi:hypothetical protein B1756_14935 [Natrarchaeobaculum aegyptiacum]|uniref:Uncharacterized protein n=1 Tax=Natrarchaeobaculum aegyptiacum TaxID=745377 RepID=A0A2Z2HXF7_9EURY|nr:hypothetical protein B1756_14935 [Natrarchaeobaculum aegyptiacum]